MVTQLPATPTVLIDNEKKSAMCKPVGRSAGPGTVDPDSDLTDPDPDLADPEPNPADPDLAV